VVLIWCLPVKPKPCKKALDGKEVGKGPRLV
jgi:hypothetical protein